MTQPYDGTGRYEPSRLGHDDPSTADQAKAQAAGVAGEARTQAAGVAADAKQEGRRVVEQAAGEARDIASHAKDEARGLFGQAQSELSAQAGSQQQRLVDLLRSVGEELGGILDPHNTDYRQGMVTDLAQQASTRLQGATSFLENRQPHEVLDEVSRFARRRPGAFLAIAALAGLAVGRLSRGMADDARQEQERGYAGYVDYPATSAYRDTYAGGYGYAAPVTPAATTSYGSQGYVDTTAGTYTGTTQGGAYDTGATGAPTYGAPTGSAYPATGTPYTASGAPATPYGEVLEAGHAPESPEPRRFPTVPEPEQTYTPPSGLATDEDSR